MIINQNSLTLSHSSPAPASSSTLSASPRPETAHFKPISDRPASCTSAENHKLFYWMKFLQSDELSSTDSRYTTSLLCGCVCESVPLVKYWRKKNNGDFQGLLTLCICHCFPPDLCQWARSFRKLNFLDKYLTLYLRACERPSIIFPGHVARTHEYRQRMFVYTQKPPSVQNSLIRGTFAAPRRRCRLPLCLYLRASVEEGAVCVEDVDISTHLHPPHHHHHHHHPSPLSPAPPSHTAVCNANTAGPLGLRCQGN